MHGFFALMGKLERHLEEVRWGTEPRPLTDDDYQTWYDAADQQTPDRTLDWAAASIRRYNIWKWNQMMRDYRWLQKRMKKLGLNPEDARYLYQ